MLETDFKHVIDILFTLFSMLLIIFMVLGFVMLEAGLVCTKNVSAVLTANVMLYAGIILSIINKLVPFRAEDDVHVEGLALNEIGVEAYLEFKRTI